MKGSVVYILYIFGLVCGSSESLFSTSDPLSSISGSVPSPSESLSSTSESVSSSSVSSSSSVDFLESIHFGGMHRGSELKKSLIQLMDLLRFPMVDLILTYPLNEDGRDSSLGQKKLSQFGRVIEDLLAIAPRLSKSDRKQIADACAELTILHEWRRSVGFLLATMINNVPEDAIVRSIGLDLIERFVDFVKAFNLRSGNFLASKQLKLFVEGLEVIKAEDRFLDNDCFCGTSSVVTTLLPVLSERAVPMGDSAVPLTTVLPVGEFEHVDALPTKRRRSSSGSSSSGDQLLARLSGDMHPHRPKACAICHEARKQHMDLKIEEIMQMVASQVSQSSLDKKFNCKSFYEHVADIVNYWYLVSHTGRGSSEKFFTFCKTSGDSLLRYLNRCDMRKFESIVLAVKFGRICGPDTLSLNSRFALIPSMLLTSVTPVERERGVVDDDEEVDEDSEFWDTELHVTNADPSILVKQSFDQMTSLNRFAFEVPVVVSFDETPAEGDGPRKEWQSLFLQHVMRPEYGLFEYSDDRRLFVKPAPLGPEMSPADKEAKLLEYRQVGRVMASCVRDKQSPQTAFTHGAVALFLELDNMKDVEKYLELENPVLGTSMDNLVLDYVKKDWTEAPPPVEAMELTFDGLIATSGVAVTEANIDQYIRLVRMNTVFDSIRPQMHALITGFFEVVPYGSLAFLTVDEVLPMLRGEREVNVDDLRASASYTETTIETAPTIQWFWEIVGSFSSEEKQDLIRFVSGSPMVPINGFSGLTGDKKWLSVSLEASLKLDQVPLAQTCFTQIRIPHYSSSAIMRTRILTAIQHAKTLENK